MTLRQKIGCRIMDVYGDIEITEREYEDMMDDIMNEISKDVYGISMEEKLAASAEAAED